MERLTERDDKGNLLFSGKQVYAGDFYEAASCLEEYEDTGLDPEQIRELKERDTPKKVRYQNRHGEGYDYKNEDYYHCPSCGRRLRNKKHDPVCPRCAQLLDWRIDNARDTIQSKADR